MIRSFGQNRNLTPEKTQFIDVRKSLCYMLFDIHEYLMQNLINVIKCLIDVNFCSILYIF